MLKIICGSQLSTFVESQAEYCVSEDRAKSKADKLGGREEGGEIERKRFLTPGVIKKGSIWTKSLAKTKHLDVDNGA